MEVTCTEEYTREEELGKITPMLQTGTQEAHSYDRETDLLSRHGWKFTFQVVAVRWLDKYTTWDVWQTRPLQNTRLIKHRTEQAQYLGFFYRAEPGAYRAFAPGLGENDPAFVDAGTYETERAALRGLTGSYRVDHWTARKPHSIYHEEKSVLVFMGPDSTEPKYPLTRLSTGNEVRYNPNNNKLTDITPNMRVKKNYSRETINFEGGE